MFSQAEPQTSLDELLLIKPGGCAGSLHHLLINVQFPGTGAVVFSFVCLGCLVFFLVVFVFLCAFFGLFFVGFCIVVYLYFWVEDQRFKMDLNSLHMPTQRNALRKEQGTKAGDRRFKRGSCLRCVPTMAVANATVVASKTGCQPIGRRTKRRIPCIAGLVVLFLGSSFFYETQNGFGCGLFSLDINKGSWKTP